MSMQDTIADMMTRIRNAQRVAKEQVTMPFSKVKAAISEVLKEEGYITDFNKTGTDKKPELVIILKYYNGKGVIQEIKRVSHPGMRVYRSAQDLPRVMGGLGIAIISTSKGIMSDRAARAAGQGGEIIGEVC